MDRLGPDNFSTLQMKGHVLHRARAPLHNRYIIGYQNPILFESTLTIPLKYTISFLFMDVGSTPVFFINLTD